MQSTDCKSVLAREGRFNVQLNNFGVCAEIVVYNGLGAVIVKKEAYGQSAQFNLGSIKKGIYFVKTIGKNDCLVQKIIVQ